MTPPPEFSALPPSGIYEASPKAISGGTSYLRVRLEFLPYPHLLATLFNGCAFGPPLPFTAASAWTWVDHPVSGPHALTLRALNAWFPFGSGASHLNLAYARGSPDRSTKSTRLGSRGPSTVCRSGGSGSLSLPSRGPFHLSLTVLFSIGHLWYLALRGGPRSFPQGFSCPVVLWIAPRFFRLRLRGSHPLWPAFPGPFGCLILRFVTLLTPTRSRAGLGSSGFARRYFRNRCFFLFLRLLRCFSSPGSLQ